MNGFDFISDSPRTLIFQKSSNKTNLGGILTFIYLIIVILIVGAYILDYFLNEKYEYSYFYKDISGNKTERERIKKTDNDKNPVVNFTIKLEDYYGNPLDKEKFLFIDGYYGGEFPFIFADNVNSLNIKRKVDSFKVFLYKRCEDERCNFTEKEIRKYRFMHISYDSQIVDHDNDNKPIKNETIHRYHQLDIDNDYILACSANWEISSYEDVKGVEKIFDYLTGNKLNFTFGNFEAINCIKNKSYSGKITFFKDDGPQHFKLISSFELKNELYGINIYKRKKKSLMDYAANIASLCATIYSIMSKAFGFIYSRNFDSYKIVENILSKGSKSRKIKEIELSDNVRNGTNSLDSDLNNNFIGKDNEIKDFNNDFNDNDTDNFIENEEISRNNENDNVSVKLPKLRMYDFFFNNVYSPKCCATLKKQKLLSSCENILFKYFSIENILYNQIKFENLMKDYKWNDLSLKSIQKNDLITEIKKYI